MVFTFTPDAITAARKARGWSQQRLALEAGLTRKTVGNVENGITVPTLEALMALAGALEVPIGSLFRVHAAEVSTPSTRRGSIPRHEPAPTDAGRRVPVGADHRGA